MQVSGIPRERAGIVLLLALLSVVFVFGGASRPDAFSQVLVRSGAVIVGAIALLRLTWADLVPIRPIALIVVSYLAAALLQLVPLPPVVWTSLPMRDLFADTALAVGMQQPWRPISLVPEATLNSALACLPALAALLCFARVSSRAWLPVVAMIVAFTLISGVLGLIQISSGKFYFYAVTNRENAVGLLANRNHQAALLAAAIPALATLAFLGPRRLPVSMRNAVAFVVALFIVPLTLVTGSRAGLVLVLIGLAGAVALGASGRHLLVRDGEEPRVIKSSARMSRLLAIGSGIALAAVVGLTIFLSRAVSVQRLFDKDIEGDARILLFRPMVDIASDAFPFGTGFGSFANIFKVFEPAWRLGPTYFNHAHNDALEIIIEGGVISLILAAAFIFWWGRTAFKVWRTPNVDRVIMCARLGTVQTLIFLTASLSDYPLRVPLCQLVFVVGCGFMAVASHRLSRAAAASDRPRNGLDDLAMIV